ncbi:helix-turn-helix transcriptional regulator [Allosphingosinicella sp.]|uniref:helix-turn-helix transcriptional regulator n=1 Tax=Allosphingosinicella sp. TaxID=2823234 RepID=UPI003783DE81
MAAVDVIGTRRQGIMRLLLEHKDGLSVDQLAARLGITRTAIREHLTGLERDRLIAQGISRPSTGGRPSRPYLLTEQGHALFPKHYALLARLLIEDLAERGEANVEEALTAMGTRLAARMKGEVEGGTLAERGASVARLMSGLGYEAAFRAGDEPAIEALNCVYHDLAAGNPAICALDLALVGGLADADVEHRSCMARGDNACTFCLKPKRA